MAPSSRIENLIDSHLENNEIYIDEDLVRRLIRSQFPRWSDLPIKRVEFDGVDNRTYYLGNDMSIRLPAYRGNARQVKKEHEWLPKLAPHLPLPIPRPIAKGSPSNEFPLPWSIYKWLDGNDAERESFTDPIKTAKTLGDFLSALMKCDATGWPSPGYETLFRGGPPAVFTDEGFKLISELQGSIDETTAASILKTALAAPAWQGDPVWFHGDLSPSNLLVENGELSAVIDFGCSAVGDPACDLTFAWMIFHGESLAAFQAALPFDEATWDRGRGWSLWKNMFDAVHFLETRPHVAAKALATCKAVIADFKIHRNVSP